MKARIALCVVAMSMALFGRADPVFYDSSGTWVHQGQGNIVTSSETLLVPPSTFGSFPALASLTESDTFDIATVTFSSGVATYSNGSGDTLTLNLTFTGTTLDKDSQTIAAMGTWVYAAGTGAYAAQNISGGSGTFTVSFTDIYSDTGGNAAKVVVGSLNPVPEPATLLAVGSCVAALARRRVRRGLDAQPRRS